jgi:uncharacterized protein (TIGR00106 family)
MKPKGRAHPKVIGDVSIYPIGEGTSLGEYVRAASRAMGTVPGLRMVPGAMSTVLEADDLSTILAAVRKGHRALVRMGAPRIAIHLRIDHRLDKPETIEYKVGRIRGAR